MPTGERYLTPERRAARDARRALFGRRLRELRRERGLSQAQLATRASLDRRFVVDIELARQSLLVDRLWELAAALEVDARELLAPPSDAKPAAARGE